MKYPKNTYSLAHAAHLMQFPGGLPNFIFWLRRQKYLSGDFIPHQACVKEGWFISVPEEIPGRTRSQRDAVLIPRLTFKGLTYFTSLFDDYAAFESKSRNEAAR